MTYSIKQYASALADMLEEASPEDARRVARGLIALLGRRGGLRHLTRIMQELERVLLRRKGAHKVAVESVSGMTPKIRKEIEEALGKNVVIEESVNPDILAGIKMVVDDELLIDATGRTQIANVFRH